MFAGSRFCARCGAEVTRELIDDATPLPCPRCREPMQALRLGETAARECGACGGLWLDPSSLQKLSDGREDHADVVHYVPCPECGQLMNRKNFAQSSGVILDVCAKDGIWLDRGELERVLGFVSGGGLARARAHEQERLIEEQRRLLALQTSQPGQLGAHDLGHSVHVNVTWGASQYPANVSLENLVRDALKAFKPL
jgi:Zn-finger nucleic acid-binding protein